MVQRDRLSGRVVLVTGAAGDIGRAAARRAHADGATVVVSDVAAQAAELEALAAELSDSGSTAVDVQPLDVTDQSGVEEVVGAVADQLGPPTGLVTCAGIQGPFSPLWEQPIEELRQVLEVNVVGTQLLVAACARRLRGVEAAGAFVLVASMAGVTGAPNMAGYSASKAAVLGLMRTAAKDLAPAGIRVNAVSPAFIGPGRMWDRQVELQAAANSQYYAADPDVVAEQMIGSVPMRRYGSTDEVASAIAFLLSDDSSYVTGVNLEVSGGSA